MRADRAFIEAVRHARQFDLAVDRLVRDAQQHAVGHAHAEALRGDARAFHVHRDRARLREQLPLG